jgi:cell wall-associated NlpC family hydrolase
LGVHSRPSSVQPPSSDRGTTTTVTTEATATTTADAALRSTRSAAPLRWLPTLGAKRLVPAAAAAALAILAVASPASASVPGNNGLNWAEAHANGCWYSYGGTSCSPGYDCSGLVSTAVYAANRIWLGRTTWDILASRHLRRTYRPQRGDLAFMYGGGHVEFVTAWSYTTFGAHDAGTRVGWLGWYGWPAGTQFYWISR